MLSVLLVPNPPNPVLGFLLLGRPEAVLFVGVVESGRLTEVVMLVLLLLFFSPIDRLRLSLRPGR